MPGPTAAEVADLAIDMGLLTHQQLREIWAHFGTQNVSVEEFTQLALRRGLLTNYQLERLLRGERTGYFYGPYKVLYMVGAGTFARVFRAVHNETGQVAAVKVLRRRYAEDRKVADRFIREGELGRTLRHPNIVPIYEVCPHREHPFLVMEFVEGRNLRDFVKIRKKVDPLQATKLMIDITSGLRYAHERGISHRDLKMTNVLVSSRGQAKLVDFGLAENGNGDERKRNPRTIDYAALEEATGAPKGDPRSDIYFLGCIYYHMLIGRWPLPERRERNQPLTKRNFLEVLPVQDIDKSIPRCVAVVVNKCMALKPDQRYQTPGEVLFDLGLAARELSGEEVEATQLANGTQVQEATPEVPAEKVEYRATIMIVEANIKMQEIFRKGLRKAGYRALITTDPERALNRFLQEDTAPASCVVINAQDLGRPAVTGFNRFAQEEITKHVPVILLLDRDQRHLREEVHQDDEHVVMLLPLKMKDLLAKIEALLAAKEGDFTLAE